MPLPKVKIVCTISPSSSAPEVLTALNDKGMRAA